MTKHEGVSWLLKYLRDNSLRNPSYALPTYPGQITDIVENAYLNSLVSDLIEKINKSNLDPIDVVATEFYYYENMLEFSQENHEVAHRYASWMNDQVHSIYWYFKMVEQESSTKYLDLYLNATELQKNLVDEYLMEGQSLMEALYNVRLIDNWEDDDCVLLEGPYEKG